MGLPDFRKYYIAAHVTRVVDWHCHKRAKDWVTLEEDLSPYPLLFSPWNPGVRKSRLLLHQHLIANTLKVFDMGTKCSPISSAKGPLTPLSDNPDFQPGMGARTLSRPTPRTQLKAGDCFKEGTFLEYQTLKQTTDLPTLPFWTYLQIRS